MHYSVLVCIICLQNNMWNLILSAGNSFGLFRTKTSQFKKYLRSYPQIYKYISTCVKIDPVISEYLILTLHWCREVGRPDFFFFWQHVSVIVKYSWIHLPHRSILNHLACTRCQPCVIFLAEVFIKGSRFLYVYWIYATPWNSILITSTFSILNIDCCEISHKMCEKKWRARNCI